MKAESFRPTCSFYISSLIIFVEYHCYYIIIVNNGYNYFLHIYYIKTSTFVFVCFISLILLVTRFSTCPTSQSFVMFQWKTCGKSVVHSPEKRVTLSYITPNSPVPVSYTHLDVYKRQVFGLYDIL